VPFGCTAIPGLCAKPIIDILAGGETPTGFHALSSRF
jgi:GrpB-like predicted nucleotidyltransferase (UPF0157 family)